MSDDWTEHGLTAKPWFKPAVGVWFAVLAGLGLYLMPASVHAAIKGATGLGGPLVVALVAALAGFLIGYAIAALIARSGRRRAIAPGLEPHDVGAWNDTVETAELRRRRVFSAREDIGEDGIGTRTPMLDDQPEPARAFEDILAEIPEAAAPEYAPDEDWSDEDWDAVEEVMANPQPEIVAEPVAHDPPIEDAEFETIEEDEPAPAVVDPALASTPIASDTRAFGDMSLEQLEERLAAALESRKQASATPAGATGEDSPLDDPDRDDPVIAFLRREASRQMPERVPAPPRTEYDPQAALREALDKLGRVGKPAE